ncbi:Nucleolar GTP-binding protein 2 [Zancudomyces culisetae]|uniref:Nucleolar GTP-binding protein 2 n=1 Tax=Zancudomyces culisetae TaxID=1213189 RepID=A0A1R1PX23_ZANCU|nr:Nucleolar GTP-binding protein 2 [Zancudomyces culisetae]|eukprot:OMH85491.1 Nucleolar GTP-binding protein 2 [Zancudomyces culisetae]
MGKTNKATDKQSGMGNQVIKGQNFYHDRKKASYLRLLKSGKPTRDRSGKIVKAADFQSTEAKVGRVEPNRRWFGNTRVIGQKALEEFREKLGSKVNDPYQVLLRQNKLPMSLLTSSNAEGGLINKRSVLAVESFGSTFGPKAQRKRPKLSVEDISELAKDTEEKNSNYEVEKDVNMREQEEKISKEWYLGAGASKRIWNELYKVIDSSDVVVHVLDARDPVGTRCRQVEKYISKEAPHKHLIYVLNKVDLVPTWVTSRWVKHLSKERPTLAFHASINNSFGKGSLIQLLRQFSKLHSDKKQISVGFIGYPNTGKSSIINTLRKKKVCNVAPIPGETKVWQYITLMRRIYLIDCPGVIQSNTSDTDIDIVLRGSVRSNNLESPEDYIPEILSRVRKEYIQRTYNIENWADSTEFLTELAQSTGKLNKGNQPDLHVVSKMVINDWLRGKLPRYVLPPGDQDGPEQQTTISEADLGMMEGINQSLTKIPVMTEYLPIDLKNEKSQKPQEEQEAEQKDSVEFVPESSSTDPEKATEEKPAREVDWDDVFGSVVGEAVNADPEELQNENDAEDSELDSEDIDSDDSDAERDQSSKKRTHRLTTNKLNTTKNFYQLNKVNGKSKSKSKSKASTKLMRLPGSMRSAKTKPKK